jgi:hypothetical protein
VVSYLKNNQAKKYWGCGSRIPTSEAQSREFKPQHHQKEEEGEEEEQQQNYHLWV